ncbi:hypothetical protein GCM10007874_09880 [Labrys miyagiensis]|uniref:Uncharacterized protein n=1 Tax=Labrys miyagiensis TaxID=346912 RepID=A0ABQ6CC92_9HYPH|nr:hypothetical protein [Labrys miyagiensis]GLS17972.1 hypothetical protein GCM10007874_09880 [Labrys miyagiensis]
MNESDRPLGVDEVIPLAGHLAHDDDTFIVGGQATNLWAWFYRDRDRHLKDAEPFTSQDVDYYGLPQVARRFVARAGGDLFLPQAGDMNSPNSAVVRLELHGRRITVDFLHTILGVSREELETGVSGITVMADTTAGPTSLELKVMHPVPCMISRAANMLHRATRRRDATAFKQLSASLIVARLYIEDALADGDIKEAQECLSQILVYLGKNPLGRRVHEELGCDPLEIVEAFHDDVRLDPRYRELTLARGIERLKAKRQSRAAERQRRSARTQVER